MYLTNSYISEKEVYFKNFGTSHVAVDEGRGLRAEKGVSLGDCQRLCDQNPACNSFAYCDSPSHSKECFTKNKVLTGMEPKKKNEGCTTYFRGLRA